MEATPAWIEEQVPAFLATAFARLGKEGAGGGGEGGEAVDRQSIRQGHAFILAGACLALGLRFASTADKGAAQSVRGVLLHFRRMRETYPGGKGGREGGRDPVARAQRPERPVLEMCLGTAAVALGLVMAGSGDLASFKLLRALRWRADPEVGGATGGRGPSLPSLSPARSSSGRLPAPAPGLLRPPHGAAHGHRFPFPGRGPRRPLSLRLRRRRPGGRSLPAPARPYQRQPVLAPGEGGGVPSFRPSAAREGIRRGRE